MVVNFTSMSKLICSISVIQVAATFSLKDSTTFHHNNMLTNDEPNYIIHTKKESNGKAHYIIHT